MLQSSLGETSSRHHVGKGLEDHAYPHRPTRNKKPALSAEQHPGQARRSVKDASPGPIHVYLKHNSTFKCKAAHLECLLPNLH